MPDKETEPKPAAHEVYEKYGKTYNVYDRETLYSEAWAELVTEVAKRYMVSDAALRKICHSMDIPLPPRGYWAKLRAGIAVEKAPLPAAAGVTRKTGARTERNASL